MAVAACKAGTDDKGDKGDKDDGEAVESRPVESKLSCDNEALEDLSAELEAAAGWRASHRVWRGLESACGDAIPKPLAQALRPRDPDDGEMFGHDWLEASAAYKKRACPDIESVLKDAIDMGVSERSATVYQRCDFARYDVIDAKHANADGLGGLMEFSFHQWMLDSGVDPATARPITQALFAQQAMGTYTDSLPADFQMPVADAPPVSGYHLLTVTEGGIAFHDETLVRFEDDFVIKPGDRRDGLVTALFDSLAEEVDMRKQISEARGVNWKGELLVLADARTPYTTMADLLHTAGRTEFNTISIVSERSSFGLGMSRVQPRFFDRSTTKKEKPPTMQLKDATPQMARTYDPEAEPADAPAATPFLSVELTTTGFSLASPGLDGEQTDHGAEELDAVTKRAEVVSKSAGDPSVVVVSAQPGVPLSRLLSVIEAARGADCVDEPGSCLLTDVHLVRSAAHQYRPPNGPGEACGVDRGVVMGSNWESLGLATRVRATTPRSGCPRFAWPRPRSRASSTGTSSDASSDPTSTRYAPATARGSTTIPNSRAA